MHLVRRAQVSQLLTYVLINTEMLRRRPETICFVQFILLFAIQIVR